MGLCIHSIVTTSVPLFATVLTAVYTDSQNVLTCNLALGQEAVARQFN